MCQPIKCNSKEYIVTAHGQAFLPPFKDEPGILQNVVIPLYNAVKATGSPCELICVSKLSVIDFSDEETEE